LYPEQISAWRQACITGQLSAKAQLKAERDQARADKKRITELERKRPAAPPLLGDSAQRQQFIEAAVGPGGEFFQRVFEPSGGCSGLISPDTSIGGKSIY
jgi:hypothetical protein